MAAVPPFAPHGAAAGPDGLLGVVLDSELAQSYRRADAALLRSAARRMRRARQGAARRCGEAALRIAVRGCAGSTLGPLLRPLVRHAPAPASLRQQCEEALSEDESEVVPGVAQLAEGLAATAVTSAADTAVWWGLSAALTRVLQGRGGTWAVPVGAWTAQALLREGNGQFADLAFEIRHGLPRHAARRAAAIGAAAAGDVAKNASTLLALQLAPRIAAHCPELAQRRRAFHAVTQVALPFAALTATEAALQRQLPGLQATLISFGWFAAVQACGGTGDACAPVVAGPDPWQVMGLRQRRYRDVARELHPDQRAGSVSPPAAAAAALGRYTFSEFTRAYHELMRRKGGRGSVGR
eukprot:TRINITY_DN32920_c0_g1_i1.p2 TRINITY_DN32920_c0_g1~~TRINITY_DN32920_c0_g1_i1.p2  ORF type:complete len:381 (+),score=99.80 TRINITY_DN32920_c0_g1_i1:82-1143(+)